MKPMTGRDLTLIEARAREMRARAFGDGMRALRRWIANRVAALRGLTAGSQHG